MESKDEMKRATGIRARALREQEGMSVAALALKAGVPKQYVYDLEGGARVSITNVTAVARAFRVSTDWLLGLAASPVCANAAFCALALMIDGSGS